MPSFPRGELVRRGEVAIYHVWSRCVQGNFLLGRDERTGEDWSHRRGWLVSLLEYLSGVFAVDVGNYTILENHFHAILRTRPDIVEQWDDVEAVWRWKMAWPRWDGSRWECQPSDGRIAGVLRDPRKLAWIRENLSDLSWFMARWKELIARLANAEAEKRGHFWQERYGCRALEDEAAVLTCSLYVDMNQVKAGLCDDLANMPHAAISERIRQWRQAEAAAMVEAFEREAGQGYHLPRERVEQLLAESCLAPIRGGGPLLLLPGESSVRPSMGGELPGGEPIQASGEVEEKGLREAEDASPPLADAGEDAGEDASVGRRASGGLAESGEASSESQARPEVSGGAKRRLTYRWHQRFTARGAQRRSPRENFLTMPFAEYQSIAEWVCLWLLAARAGPAEARSASSWPLPSGILERLGSLGVHNAESWLEAIDNFDQWFTFAVGGQQGLRRFLERRGRRWLRGGPRCRDTFT